MQAVLDVLVLQTAQALIGTGDGVEGFENLGLELGFDRGKRKRAFHVVFVVVAFAGRRRFAIALLAGCALAGRLERSPGRRSDRGGLHERGCAHGCGTEFDTGNAGHARHRGHVLGVGAGVGRFEIDDVAQEDLGVVEFVAPDDDGLKRQRAFAKPCDHRFAAGLDAFGNGDFALAREQLHRAHLAQVHSDGVVGALGG